MSPLVVESRSSQESVGVAKKEKVRIIFFGLAESSVLKKCGVAKKEKCRCCRRIVSVGSQRKCWCCRVVSVYVTPVLTIGAPGGGDGGDSTVVVVAAAAAALNGCAQLSHSPPHQSACVLY